MKDIVPNGIDHEIEKEREERSKNREPLITLVKDRVADRHSHGCSNKDWGSRTGKWGGLPAMQKCSAT